MWKRMRVIARSICASALSVAIVAGMAGQAEGRRALTLKEAAALKIVKNDEKSQITVGVGSGKGTLRGSVHMRVHVVDGSKLSARFVSKSRGGALYGTGRARYYVSGSILRFFGAVKITGGTRRYSRARGRGIEIEGVMNRRRERMRMTLNGRFSF